MKNGLASVVLSCLAVISSSTAAHAQLTYHIDKDVVTVGEAVMMDTSPAPGTPWVESAVDDDGISYQLRNPYFTCFNPPVAAPNVTTVFTRFLRPGFHWVNLKLGSSNQWLEFTVTADRDYEKFNAPQFADKWSAYGMALKSGDTQPSSYSLQEKPGNLVLQVLNDSAKPLSFNSTVSNVHPLLLTPITNYSDSGILTELEVLSAQSSNYFTGLYFETVENGVIAKYAFGLEGGALAAKRSTGGAYTTIPPQAYGSFPPDLTGKVRLRIRYNRGQYIRFEAGTETTGQWYTHTLFGAGSSSVNYINGGLFLSTSTPQTTKVAFDSYMLINPVSTDPGDSSVRNGLRITELMYHPMSPDTVEYIELRNQSGSPINLKDVRFAVGVTATLGDETLAPTEFGVVTNNKAAFQAMYPGVRVLGEYRGDLNDDGEAILLLDANLQTIHSFSYDDESPWPTAADGSGSAIEIINPHNLAAYGSSSNWKVTGAFPGGGFDSDSDGTPDAIEGKFGTDAGNPLSKPTVTTATNPSAQTVITWPSVSGQLYNVEYCNVLGQPWTTLTGGSNIIGVTGNTSHTDPSSVGVTQRFYRIRAL